MLKKFIKKIFSTVGVEIRRKSKIKEDPKIHFSSEEVYRLKWLMDQKINTVIDIGANEGQFAKKIISIFPKAKIHCFEPLPNVFEKLSYNFKDNSNISFYNFALGNVNEDMVIHSNEFSPSSSLLEMLDLHKTNFNFAVNTEEIPIKINRLDDVFNIPVKTPLLIKIDVQGYEMNVLKGGEKTIPLAAIVIVETSFVPLYRDQPLFADIYQYFIERGFEYAGNLDQLISPMNQQVLHADALFLKKQK